MYTLSEIQSGRSLGVGEDAELLAKRMAIRPKTPSAFYCFIFRLDVGAIFILFYGSNQVSKFALFELKMPGFVLEIQRSCWRGAWPFVRKRQVHFYLTKCVYQLVLESQRPHKPSIEFFIINSKQFVNDYVGGLTF